MAKKVAEETAGEEILVLHEKWVSVARRYLREIVAGVVGLVLILALWTGYNSYQETRENQALRLYVQALSSKDKKERQTLWEEILKKYPGTLAARESLLHLWELKLLNPKARPGEELAQLQKALPGSLMPSFKLAEGYLAEEKKDFVSAQKSYLQVLRKAPYSKAIVYLDLARTYENLKDWSKALEMYQKYLKEYPKNNYLNFIEYKLAKIQAQLPTK